MSRRIVITGATGTLGRHLVEILKDDEVLKVTHTEKAAAGSVQTNLSQYDHNFANRLKEFKPTHIIHAAAVQNSNPDCYALNTLMTANMTYQASQFGAKFIFISSSTVYGDKGLEKVCEIEDAEVEGTTDYANSKIDGELFTEFLDAYLIFRPCAMIDPAAKRGLLYDIVYKLKEESNQITLMGNEPGSIKPYISTQCVADYIADRLEETGIYNVAPNDNLSVKTIVEEAMDISGKNKVVCWGGENFAGDNPVVAMKSDIGASSIEFIRAYFEEVFK